MFTATNTLLRQYDRIFSTISDGVALVDRNYIYQIVNQTYAKWNNRKQTDIVGNSVSHLFGDDIFQRHLKPHFDQALAGEANYLEGWVNYADGHDRFVRRNFCPYLEPDDTITGVVVVVHDLTHLKQTEIAIAAAKEQPIAAAKEQQCFHHNCQLLRLGVIPLDLGDRKATEIALEQQRQFTEEIAESSLAIIYIYDLIENRNIYVNSQIETILGYTPDEIQAMGSNLLSSLIHPEDLPRQMISYQHCLSLADGEVLESEYRMRHKNGDYRWLLSRDRVFNRTATGAPRQMLGVATDITRLKQAEASLYQQTRHEQLVATITNRIRQSLNNEDILATTVQEVQQVLQADRVLIFQLHQDGSGIVVAEAVVPDYPVTEKMRWLDECFPDACYEFYRQGQPRIVPDVATDEWASCLAEFMQEVGVKSKVVSPIVQTQGEGITQPRVWGLLIAHACTHYRDWQPNEADLLHRIADNLAIAIHQSHLYQKVQQELAERQRAEAALHRLNQALEQRVQERTQALQDQAERERLLRLIIQNIYRSLDIDDVLTTVLTETRQTLRADRVAIYQFNPDWSGAFIAESVGSGWVPLVGPAVQPIWADTYLQETQGGRYQNHETLAVNDIYQAGHQPCHIALLEQFQARAYVIVPIFVQEHLWGLLAAYQNSGPRTWQVWEINLLQQTGLQTAIALRQSQLYQAAQSQVKELERLNQLKDDFLSTVSHELRSPMANIKMAIQMLELHLVRQGTLDMTQNTPFNHYFQILREECQREISLINDLLDLTRLDANTDPLPLSPLHLRPWIHRLVATFAERTRQQQQQLKIDIPETLVLATETTALERIIVELLHNACKYTPAGETICIAARSLQRPLQLEASSASAHPERQSMMNIQLCISNSGVEIPTTECDRIFDKFYRIPNHDPWKHGGTGLGLALVKKLVERLGGTICVKSKNQLTTFILEFPEMALDRSSLLESSHHHSK